MEKLTNQEVINLYHDGLPLLKPLKGVLFNDNIDRNRRRLKAEVEIIEKMIEPFEDYTKYDEKRIELNKECAKKNADGEPVMAPIETNPRYSRYVIDKTKQKEFESRHKELMEEYKEAIDSRNKQIKEFNEYLTLESTLSLIPLDLKLVPQDIDGQQFAVVSCFIERKDE